MKLQIWSGAEIRPLLCFLGSAYHGGFQPLGLFLGIRSEGPINKIVVAEKLESILVCGAFVTGWLVSLVEVLILGEDCNNTFATAKIVKSLIGPPVMGILAGGGE